MDDCGRIVFFRPSHELSLWDNPHVLGEVIVRHHWDEITDQPSPHDHWESSAALLVLGSDTAGDREVWKWAVDMAIATRVPWLAE